MTWDEICEHPDLRDLPFRFESNRWGQVVLTPLHNGLGFLQGGIYDRLKKLMPNGCCRHTTNIITRDGTKVAHNAWLSAGFWREHQGESSYRFAPEIVIVTESPMDSLAELLEKKELFLEAGALEVWVRKGSGQMLFYSRDGLRERSALCPGFPVCVKAD